MNDVIVLLPGIMGSALAKGGHPVWDLSPGAIGRAVFSLGSSIDILKLTSDASTGDGVTATRVLPDAHIVPFWWKIDGYADVVKFIRSKFDVAPGENFVEFPYDWRLDNSISAQRLAEVAMNRLESWRTLHPSAQLILIGHSMGGLVARYFLEVLGGWRHTKMLVTLGTPHRGSVKALDFLANGLRKKIGPVTLIELTALIQSFPSAYQLLPIYPCVGEEEHELQALEHLNIKTLGSLDMERAREGIAFHRKIERCIKVNERDPMYIASRYRLLPVVGTYQPTFQSALLTDDGVRPLYTYKGQTMLDGDGTVPRLSATPIELSKSKVETFVACPHASLQNFDPVRVQLRAALEDVDISELKAVGPEAISIDLLDAYSTGESFCVRARCESSEGPMQAVLTNLETSVTTEHEFDARVSKDGWQELWVPSLQPGAYRIRVAADDNAEPIEDLFVVLE
ncbi:MAG: hypothetical protein P0119_17200 [Nitrospira sp.]|nr:hypothetical protein [Nitrospira sp.]